MTDPQPYTVGDEKFRNFTPPPRHDPWERRPVAYQGGEWFALQPKPRMTLAGWQWLLAFTLGALSWGLVVVLVIIANSVRA